jgi:UDP-N-acetylmuramate-alanine ligase
VRAGGHARQDDDHGDHRLGVRAGRLPGSHLVGAPLQGSHGNARYTVGSPFVLEADEYRGAFLEYA